VLSYKNIQRLQLLVLAATVIAAILGHHGGGSGRIGH
jgi:hypothetical protein